MSTGQSIINHQKLKQRPKQHHLMERQQAGSGSIRLLNVPGKTWRSVNEPVKLPDRHDIPEGVTINAKDDIILALSTCLKLANRY